MNFYKRQRFFPNFVNRSLPLAALSTRAGANFQGFTIFNSLILEVYLTSTEFPSLNSLILEVCPLAPSTFHSGESLCSEVKPLALSALLSFEPP